MNSDVSKILKVQQMVHAYQSLGHLKAKVNPLNLQGSGIASKIPAELELSHYGFTDADLDCSFPLDGTSLPNFAHGRQSITLREIVSKLEESYCGSVGVEYTHIPDREKQEWIRSRLEVPQPARFSSEEKKELLRGLASASSFEKFIATKYPVEKRYGLDGGESLVPGMKALVNRCVEHGAKDVIVGSQHRGRLNVMSNVMGLPNELVFQRFAGDMSLIEGQTGDVKYHLGIDNQLVTPSGKEFNVSFLPNPSHLEAEDPVAVGKTRAIQESHGNNLDEAVCINIHGDAAIAGQGIVYETLTLSNLSNYSVGGVIHVTVNNQVGFTTDPQDSRSTHYCTDIAKTFNAPIFHVNGADPEAVAFIFQLAADWRATFHTDCFIDLVCYRKFGHNEMDQPAYTNPALYDVIGRQPPVLDQYAEKLLSEKVVSEQDISDIKRRIWDDLSASFEASKTYEPPGNVLYPHLYWSSLPSPTALTTTTLPTPRTSVPASTIHTIASKLASLPSPTFTLHPNLSRILATRQKTLTDGTHIDFPTAEALAFSTLLLAGHPIRLSGQDAARGTFSQRHAVLHNQTPSAPRTWTPLAHLSAAQARFAAANSPLSEAGALGFEYGYSLGAPGALVVWEAQFGDFANGAQVLVDNFVAAGEAKWCQRSGVVLGLPHGKPLVVFFSKSLLRHPLARSKIEDFTGESGFKHIISDSEHGKGIAEPEGIERVVLCSGQVYAALHKSREANGVRNVAITRIEQWNPFPWVQVKENLDLYPNAKSIIWCQEEPFNGGAWQHIQPRIETVLKETENHREKRIGYAGRGPYAGVATGSKNVHVAEEQMLLNKALGLA
ncbi:putative alpha-ketoglutarate dehydrogenase complex subunit protein [Neofusicoccum parvum UCRNP2]|uniref:Putative alpha-ketoglutarate dehydrogenase complex subunit protein n=1 Tax=Botryosphaeria parva (strain UCR-NP2) TaxID=1287680 RepID=R1GBH3_BOTPV|nr:putative alpha-ketoglutarate dehydrogenase complex subunit protein [Neofusicoccum parvum UCRNP2]